MGAPTIKIDFVQLCAFLRLKPTLADTAAFFQCSEDTIENRIKGWTGKTFSEFRDENMVHTRFELIRNAISRANNGDNTMMIFCLKNLCDWVDRKEIDHKGSLGGPKSLSEMTEDEFRIAYERYRKIAAIKSGVDEEEE